MLCDLLAAAYVESYDFSHGRIFTRSDNLLSQLSEALEKPRSSISLVVKTHARKVPDSLLTENIVHLIRDPRDVSISYLYFIRNMPLFSINPKQLIYNILHRSIFVGPILTCLKWRKHTRNWLAVDNALRIRYEDIKKDPHAVLERASIHFSTPFSEQDIDSAVKKYSFGALYGRKPGVEDVSNSESRKGVSGDSKYKLPFPTNVLCWQIVREECLKIGYRFDYSHLA